MERAPTVSGTTNLIDILDRILDKGLVIAGDIRVSLANVELLTIRIRLLICSVDKAEQIGMNWWKFDPNLTRQVSETRSRSLPASTQNRSVASVLGGETSAFRDSRYDTAKTGITKEITMKQAEVERLRRGPDGC